MRIENLGNCKSTWLYCILKEGPRTPRCNLLSRLSKVRKWLKVMEDDKRAVFCARAPISSHKGPSDFKGTSAMLLLLQISGCSSRGTDTLTVCLKPKLAEYAVRLSEPCPDHQCQ